MKKPAAKKILYLMFEIGAALDSSVAVVQKSEDDEVFKKYRRTVGKLMGDMLFEVINPLCVEHPSLKPTQMYLPGEAVPTTAKPYRHRGIPAPRPRPKVGGGKGRREQ
ncbi:MAG: hypothetical protein QM765_42675 [Myxococcales bacterium]